MPKKNNNGQNPEEQNPIPQKVLATYFIEKTMSGITDNLVNLGMMKAQVDRIRTVRGVEAGHKDYVDLKNFGAAHARNAKLARDAEKQAKQQSKQPSRGNAGLKM